MTYRQGRHFLQIPGPSPVPDRVLRAMSAQVIDHRGPEFGVLGHEVLEGIKAVYKTTSPVIIYPSSGTGAWEATIANTLQPGDKVLMVETGHFATMWRNMAVKLGVDVEFIPGDWRHGVNAAQLEARLAEDKAHVIKAVMVVHNETSTGCTSNMAAVRKAMNNAHHPALLMIDTISGLGSVDVRHDEWEADVTVAGSQKGLMLPPGLGMVAISAKALKAAEGNATPRSYWDWKEMLAINAKGYFPYTPATNLLYALKEALAMIHEEGLEEVYARHKRLASATRAAVRAWGMDNLCLEPEHYSPVLTTVVMPEGHDADKLRAVILDKYNMSLGQGLSKVSGKVFRIGHLGECNELTLIGALGGVEMGFVAAGVPHQAGGVQAALADLEQGASNAAPSRKMA